MTIINIDLELEEAYLALLALNDAQEKHIRNKAFHEASVVGHTLLAITSRMSTELMGH